MKRMNNQKKFALKPGVASTLLALLGVAGLPAMADEAAQKAAEAAGKRVDNARVLDKAIASPGEWQPDFTYPLPSGVSRSDVQAMRAAAEPKGAPQASELVSDDRVGALFASGKADLLPAAYQQMDALVARYQGKRGLRFAVVGHTDNQRLSANTRRIFRDNPGLSEARALAVATYLREKLNLPAAAVSIRGMGEAQPVASNGTPEGMARNRRVEVKFWHAEMPVPAVAAPRLPCAPDAIYWEKVGGILAQSRFEGLHVYEDGTIKYAGYGIEICSEDIGKTVFLTEEEAERAIEEMEGKKDG